MTVPQGDLPDWQAFTAPPALSASCGDQPANTSIALISSPTPFRVWSAWLRLSICTSAAYVAAVLEWPVRLQDGAGNVLLEDAVHVVSPSQINHASNSIAIPGFTPQVNGGSYFVEVVAPATLANVFARYNAGIFYSTP